MGSDEHSMQDDSNLPQGSAAENGMDIARLEALASQLPEWGMRDVVVVRHGQLVWEWHAAGDDRLAAIYSCTKSILSALVGIAIGQGILAGPEQPAAELLPELAEAADERKRAITIGHLLTMTSGLEWPDFDKPYRRMKASADWVRYVAETPLAHAPGQVFAYNSGGSHLLSAILTRATGESALAFARKHILDKLGVRDVRWNDHGGINEGGTGIHMSSRDLAKFGLLYLQGGRWGGEQLVPEWWVRASLSPKHKGLMNYEPPIYGQYGYHWWISERSANRWADCPFAFGYGGQCLFIVPPADLVVVVRKRPAGRNQAILSHRVLFDGIAEAVLS
ncbi:serine hydrolase domain-containing protein [Paenibacillus sp. 32O-W]|uniref:serine hydrolase domain-containing protein n=1 Tax=Paenibacillus sp. 32O-W TaxID=1695218 RepID=UPI0007867C67|nr:serine hydrolase [Paenibacillus sp. 32O-W]